MAKRLSSRRPTETDILRLVDRIYSATIDQTLWPEFLQDFADSVRGTRTAIFVHDTRSNDGNLVWTARVDPAYIKLYNEYYHEKNLWVIRSAPTLKPGKVVNSPEMCPESDVLRSEYFADFLQPQDIFHNFGGTIIQENSTSAIITVMRQNGVEPFGQDEINLLASLMPHLQRAFSIQHVLRATRQEFRASTEIFDCLDFGIVIVDRQRRPVYANRLAERLLKHGDGLTVSGGELKAATLRESDALRQLIASAVSAATCRSLNAGDVMVVMRPSLGIPMAIQVCPIRWGVELCGMASAKALILIRNSETHPSLSDILLRKLYGLTSSEARLAIMISSGTTVQEAARILSISMNTARTHLKRIFSKTGTSRQAELVRVLASPAFHISGNDDQ